MSSKDCFERGLLRKEAVEKEKVLGSLELARHYIGRSKGNLEIRFYDVAFLMAYNSMFQTARALLFSDGVKERSHYCVVAYLREKYSSDKELGVFVEILDTYRQDRHGTQYAGQLVSEEEARQSYSDAQEFLHFAKKRVS
ncbi:HEPN domain-containing protein [Candidatus Micrarchaeota archaeon]|nr:HEPN domain-containing protein [Candidatus Micrarchaeota archaeon]